MSLTSVYRSVNHVMAIAAVLCGSAFSAEPEDEPAAPRWWKGNTHAHSLWSDGNDFPEMIADWYRNHGYNFLTLSDHNLLSEGILWIKYDEIVKRGGKKALDKYRERFGDEWVETRGTEGTPDFEIRLKALADVRKLVEESDHFLMIQGEEITDSAEGLRVHINAINIKNVIEPLSGRTVIEAIDNDLRAAEDQSKRTGREILTHLNHPNFGYANTAEEIASVMRCRFMEIYNGNRVDHLGDKHHASVERIFDIANTIRLGELSAPPLFGVATDDSHSFHRKGEESCPGCGWIMVRAPKLEATSLILAMKAGDMYASSGVTLRDVQYNQETKLLQLEIEPEEGIHYTTQFIGTKVGYDPRAEPCADENGAPVRATRKYSSEVGQVFATVKGASPAYQLSDQELYVRAVVTSSKLHHAPSFEDQYEQAWTQPVGWRERLARSIGRTDSNSRIKLKLKRGE